MPIGVFDDIKYTQQQEQLASGTTYFCTPTDLPKPTIPTTGSMACNASSTAAQSCIDQGDTSPEHVTATMLNAVHDYSAGASQSDDLTMLTMQYRRPQEQVLLHEPWP